MRIKTQSTAPLLFAIPANAHILLVCVTATTPAGPLPPRRLPNGPGLAVHLLQTDLGRVFPAAKGMADKPGTSDLRTTTLEAALLRNASSSVLLLFLRRIGEILSYSLKSCAELGMPIANEIRNMPVLVHRVSFDSRV